MKSRSVLQEWVCELSLMQQTVLMTAIRGPDTLHKDHVARLLLRWYRRCIVYSAFEGRVIINPYEEGGGSFNGPSISSNGGVMHWQTNMSKVVDTYLRTADEVPHHFQLHFMHAAEIVGYKHPDEQIRDWWDVVYGRLVNDMHLYPESVEQMDKRLGGNEKAWRLREEVTAKGPEEG